MPSLSNLSLHHLPIACSCFIIYIPPRVYFGAVYQFNQFAHRGKEEGLAGMEEEEELEEEEEESLHHPHILAVMHLY